MKNTGKILMIVFIVAAVVAMMILFSTTAGADTYGDFTYTVSGDNATITKYKGAAGDVVIPSEIDGKSVTSIDNYAFKDCISLTSITVPSSVTSIIINAFYGCSSLVNVTVDEANTKYTSVDGVLYDKNKTTLVCYPAGKTATSFTVPSSVTYIGIYTFLDCTSLTSINVDNANTSYTSVDGVLYNKDKTTLVCYPSGKTATSFTVPSSVTSIGDDAFYDCTSLTSIEIPLSVTSIGGNAFKYCKNLESITISSSITSIGSGAFQYCTNLTSITFGENSQLTSIGTGAFDNCTSLTSIEIPSSVTSIGRAIFRCCTSLVSLEMPSNVTSISMWAFYGCKGLTNITIPSSVTNIGSYAFYDCTGLTGITIPSSVTSIGSYAFYGCTSLTSIEIPSSVTSIGRSAFQGCTGLTSIEIPSSVTSIVDYAFDDCINISRIVFLNSDVSIGNSALSQDNRIATIYGYSGSTAETFANQNGYTFIAIENTTIEDEESDVSVDVLNYSISAGATLKVMKNVEGIAGFNISLGGLTKDVVYDISLEKDGEKVQPTGDVTVKIKLPEGYDAAKCQVWYIDGEGNKTNVKAKVEDGYLVFKTDHFSLYAVVELDHIPGDIIGNGEINNKVVTRLFQYLSGWKVDVNEKALDVNGDGKINNKDLTRLFQYLSDWDVEIY